VNSEILKDRIRSTIQVPVRFEKLGSDLPKTIEKPQWPIRGAIRLEKLQKNANTLMTEKSSTTTSVSPSRTGNVQFNFEKKVSASQLALLEKLKIPNQEIPVHPTKTLNKSVNIKKKMSVSQLELDCDTPKPAVHVYKTKAPLTNSANISMVGPDPHIGPPYQSSKYMDKPVVNINTALDKALDKAIRNCVGHDHLKNLLKEFPTQGASLLSKKKLSVRREVACVNEQQQHTKKNIGYSYDPYKAYITPNSLNMHRVSLEIRPKRVSQNPSVKVQALSLAPKLQTQMEQVYGNLRKSMVNSINISMLQ